MVEITRRDMDELNWRIGCYFREWCRGQAGVPDIRLAQKFSEEAGLMTKDVELRGRVWDRFQRGYRVVRHLHRLRWAHYAAAIDWTDEMARQMLTWANDKDATVAEMRAYHRALIGTDQETAGVEEQ